MLALRLFAAATVISHPALALACEPSATPCPDSGSFTGHGLYTGLAAAAFMLAWYWWRAPMGVAFDKDDPGKLAAEAEARATLPRFWAAHAHPAPDEGEFALKFNLSPDRDAEFIWAQDIEQRGGRIFGRLGNPPLDDRHALGDEVEIDPALIVDWTYFKGDVAQGHFMTRAMFKHMPARHVRQGKKQLGWS